MSSADQSERDTTPDRHRHSMPSSSRGRVAAADSPSTGHDRATIFARPLPVLTRPRQIAPPFPPRLVLAHTNAALGPDSAFALHRRLLTADEDGPPHPEQPRVSRPPCKSLRFSRPAANATLIICHCLLTLCTTWLCFRDDRLYESHCISFLWWSWGGRMNQDCRIKLIASHVMMSCPMQTAIRSMLYSP